MIRYIIDEISTNQRVIIIFDKYSLKEFIIRNKYLLKEKKKIKTLNLHSIY